MRLFEGTKYDRPPRCEQCGELDSDCACPPPPPLRIPPGEQTVRIAVEKRKKGKVVTAIHGLPAIGNDLPGLLSKLKTACGAGGAVKDDVIEIQGRQVEPIEQLLREEGFRIKR